MRLKASQTHEAPHPAGRGRGSRGALAYRALLAEPVELLELLRHQKLCAAHGAPDLAENCEDRHGHVGHSGSRSERVTRVGCVCASVHACTSPERAQRPSPSWRLTQWGVCECACVCQP